MVPSEGNTQMYLYRWEDGRYWQSQEPPDEDQKEAIQDGVLEVFTVIGGKFTEITPEGYVDVILRDTINEEEVNLGAIGPQQSQPRGQMKMKITEEEYAELSEDSGGICMSCEERAFGVEPDARNYTCESCGEDQVFGIEELLLRGDLELLQ